MEGGTEMASAGMWKVSYGTEGDTEEFALCSSINPDASGWPDETASPSFCRAVNASRAFFILAIAVDLFAVVYVVQMPKISFLCLLHLPPLPPCYSSLTSSLFKIYFIF